jgi:2-oxoisovalerate dehydrogenase E1 component
MPKSVAIDPKVQRKSSTLKIDPIPVNQYKKTFEEEVEARGKEATLRIYHDMAFIREFESMLDSVKKKGNYEGVEYNHRGPAHLSIGQEASAVGQAFALEVEDQILGSHRSHGEILAKGLSAIAKLEKSALNDVMRTYEDGETLSKVDNGLHSDEDDLAKDFLAYGTLAEIFGREAGFNRGMGGSMHAFFTPFGVYPNNAIVGGSADISVGAALFKLVNQKPGVVVANIGDASAGCGPTWEALCFATMDQYRELWTGDHRRGLPFIMNFVNNFYGMGGQPVGETMGFKMLARLGAGLNPENMHAERVDGYNPLAVADVYERKKETIAEGRGPVLLDTITYRFSGHSPSDASSYRERDEVEAWQQVDSLLDFGKSIVEAGVATEDDLNEVKEKIAQRILRVYELAIDLDTSPRADLSKPGNLLEQTMYSNQRVENFDETREPEILLSDEENPRVQQLAKRSRSGFGEDGKPLPKQRCIGIRDGLFEAIYHRFKTDSTLVAYGEENRDWGGAFAVYRGLTETLPYHRLFNSPISEAAIVGTGVGYALAGGRALVELMYCDFMGRAGDEIFNQMAKWQSMSGGMLKMPLVLRVSVGSKYGAQHSQDWSSMCSHIPGLKVCFPATPYDAKGLMASALVGTDPVVFFESQRIYDMAELFHEGGVPEENYEIPIGEPDVKKEGKDLTILSIGATLYRVLEAARELEEKYGMDCEIIDARSLVPFNYEKVLESVKKTRRILLTSDACERGSYLHTMASRITQLAMDELDAPPVVVGARNWITPADEVEEAFFPFPADMTDAVHFHIKPLQGYKPKTPMEREEILRLGTLGV